MSSLETFPKVLETLRAGFRRIEDVLGSSVEYIAFEGLSTGNPEEILFIEMNGKNDISM